VEHSSKCIESPWAMLLPCRGPLGSALSTQNRPTAAARYKPLPLRRGAPTRRPTPPRAAAAAAAAAPAAANPGAPDSFSQNQDYLYSFSSLKAAGSAPPVAELPPPPKTASTGAVASYLARLAVGERSLLWRVALAFVFMVISKTAGGWRLVVVD
jgi:hypothetical protein